MARKVKQSACAIFTQWVYRWDIDLLIWRLDAWMGSAVQKPDAAITETLPPGLSMILKRAEEKAIRGLKPWMIGNDTIATLLDNG